VRQGAEQGSASVAQHAAALLAALLAKQQSQQPTGRGAADETTHAAGAAQDLPRGVRQTAGRTALGRRLRCAQGRGRMTGLTRR
jgi:hypothetical protein